MSLILEALKRSEKERRERANRVTDTLYVEVTPQRRRLWPLLLATLLLVNLAILVFLWWRGGSGTPPTPPTPEATPTRPEPNPNDPVARRILRPLEQELGNARRIPLQSVTASRQAEDTQPKSPPDIAAEPATGADTKPEKTAVGPMDEATRERLDRHEINIIVYSDTASRRYALIDMKKLREGDRLPDSDLRIERIVPGALIIDTGHGLVRYSGTP